MQMLLEFLPLLAFFVAYKFYDIYWATGALIIASAIQMAITYLQTKSIPKQQWVMFIILAVFGGLTIALQNDKFILWKPTVIYLIFTLALLISQLMKKPAIKALLGQAIELPQEVWNAVNVIWAVFFAISAVANLYVAYEFEQEFWVNFKVFGMTGATLVVTVLTMMYVYKHLPEDQKNPTRDKEN